MIFQRFADARIEQRYRLEQRRRQAKFTRGMAIIAAGMFLSYSLFNPLFISWHDTTQVAIGHWSIVPLLVLYSWYAGQPGYPTSRYADLMLFVGAQPGMVYAARAFAETGASDWSFGPLLCYNVMIGLAFACLSFSASVQKFFVLAVSSIGFLLTMLFLDNESSAQIFYTGMFYGAFALLAFYLNWAIDDKGRALFAAGVRLDVEKSRSEALLHNVLPQSVAHRLRSGETVADAFPEVTIVFIDIVGFTRMSNEMDPSQVVALLNTYFGKADAGCDLFGIEKVKTIGDAYMAVAGAIVSTPRPAKAAVDFALYLIRSTSEISRAFDIDFKLHIGINSGPVMGGVIEGKKMLYDYWGNAINVASRLEGVARANGVTVSQRTWEQTREIFTFREPRPARLKGIGEVLVYDLEIP
ncbi:adenylate/guanylate cyclase domain-containing protein [Novosphingobium tardum]|uniref:adenylate cyclase n=1 Tax=Novosphingobium tardum TaxID=1538021 RepID=A0ABV8RTT4_9SPHN